MRRKRLLAVFLASCFGLVAVSAAEAEPIYVRTTTASTFLPTTAGLAGEKRVLAVTVGAGIWSIVAKASAVARFQTNTFDVIRCRITAGTRQLDSAATNVGLGSGLPSVATLALASAVRTTSNTTIALSCLHDLPIAGEYIDPDAKLMVSKQSGPLN